MNSKFKFGLTALAVLGLAACATAPQQRFASSVKAAQAANRPVVIYGFGSTVGVTPLTKLASFYGAVAFMNTAAQPIKKVVFQVTDYHGNQLVLGAAGKALQSELIAHGPFAPGSAHTLKLTGGPVRLASGTVPTFACARLTGIEVVYQDGSNVEVARQNVSEYLTPQINVNCARYSPYHPYSPFQDAFGTRNPAMHPPGFQGNSSVTHGVGGP